MNRHGLKVCPRQGPEETSRVLECKPHRDNFGDPTPVAPPSTPFTPEVISMATTTPKKLDDVPGWMIRADQWLFERILSFQVGSQAPGDLVELGVYKGKSAIVIGRHQQPGETFTVCDLFEDVTSELTLHQADRNAYRTLSEEEFANNYLAFHDTLPEVVRGLSSAIEDHVTAGSCRYIHIDASHMYVNVREDAAAARRLLRKDGVVVFDDFRTEHTIGTANAVWETIVNDDLHPICASERKMYATWGEPEPYQRELMERLAESGEFRADLHTIVREERVIRVVTNKAKKAAAAPAAAPAKTGATPVPAKAGASVPIKQFLNKVANKVQRLTA